jgi:anti-sigma factor RsiW
MNHLSEAQILDLLSGNDQPSPSSKQHLTHCAECQQELAGLRQSLNLFRVATTAFAHAEAPRSVRRPVAAPAGFRRYVWAASLATAAALISLSISLLHPGQSIQNTGRLAHPTQTAAASVSDDALLNGIDDDLATSIPPSLDPLATPATTGRTSTQN